MFSAQLHEELTATTLLLRVVRGDEILATLDVELPDKTIGAIREYSVPEIDHHNACATMLGARFAEFCTADARKIISIDDARHHARNIFLKESGFHIRKRKALFELLLKDYHSPYDDPFSYLALNHTGEENFISIFSRASEDDPFSEMYETDAATWFRELVDLAGNRFDASRWQIAMLNGQAVGVVLPQEYHDAPGLGTLFYIGVVPEFRGNGFGRMLHAAGLEDLARHGIARYVGSTDESNAAMIHVFTANGCERTCTQLYFDAEEI